MRSRRSPSTRSRRNIIVMTAATLFTAACAEGPFYSWGGRRKPTGQWPTENPSCRAYAKKKTEQEFALAESTGPGMDYSRTTGYNSQVGRYDARKREKSLYNLCMKQRGYERKTDETKKDDAEEK